MSVVSRRIMALKACMSAATETLCTLAFCFFPPQEREWWGRGRGKDVPQEGEGGGRSVSSRTFVLITSQKPVQNLFLVKQGRDGGQGGGMLSQTTLLLITRLKPVQKAFLLIQHNRFDMPVLVWCKKQQWLTTITQALGQGISGSPALQKLIRQGRTHASRSTDERH